MSRRVLLAGLGAWPLAGARAAPAGFSWDALKRRAAALAARPYVPQPETAGAEAVDFDAAGRIRFDAARTLFADRPGAVKVRLFAPNISARHGVALNLIEGGAARPLPYDRSWFDAPAETAVPPGVSGFRAMNAAGESDWLAFQGASYFRAAGSQDQYGLSARAVAIDAGLEREQFPAFTEFWLGQGEGGALVVHSLLDGENVTGAFRFTCRQGLRGVTQEVDAFLKLRRDVARLGLAPATSMFWYGQADRRAATDWRPEIHDSDGLAMATGAGERLWRPLVNPPRAVLSSFADRDPQGFGLLQRDRAFDHYQDDGAFYDRRPGLWVTPRGRWGAGAVQLYAFPTRSETIDNIVAWWSPAAAAKAGAVYDYGYRLDWSSDDPAPAPLARATDLFAGAGGIPGAPPTPGVNKLVADFAGPALAGLDRDAGVTISAAVERATLRSSVAYPIAGRDGVWRAMVELADLAGGDPTELRLVLARGGRPISETLLVQLFP